jgi:hypothetical protein
MSRLLNDVRLGLPFGGRVFRERFETLGDVSGAGAGGLRGVG